MRPGEIVTVHGIEFRLIEHPPYALAHPGESCDADERCARCAIAERVDTGARHILWLCGGVNWSVNRNDPLYATLAAA